jgi:hypothetical protein
MATAEDIVVHGERSGAWPTALRFADLFTATGLKAPERGVVATYAAHPEACLSVVGDRYRATTCAEWRMLVKAACDAGAKPTGAFSLRDGTRVLATFEVGQSNGLRTQLLLADSFDGTMKLTLGTSSIRVVCANTLSAALKSDGDGMALLRHTASLEQKVNILAESIKESIASGEKVRTVYHAAEATRLARKDATRIFDLLWPEPEEKSNSKAKTMAQNARKDAEAAMADPVNNVGPTLATIWNAATYLVDRRADGSAREARGGDSLDSMLFGARAQRVNEIQTIIETVMRDGSIQPMKATEALDAGIDPSIIGRKVLEDMLADC